MHGQAERSGGGRVRQLVQDDARVEERRVRERPPERLLLGEPRTRQPAIEVPDDEGREEEPGDR